MAFGLFKKNKKAEDVAIYAPTTGKVVALEDVPDPVFSQKMMGEGIAVEPVEGKIVAPCDGKIMQVAPTKHAVGILAADGAEILIHVGLDTVNLKGEGFEAHVKEDDTVSKGDVLLTFDLELIREKVPSTVTPIVITNSGQLEKEFLFTEEKEAVQGETVLIQGK